MYLYATTMYYIIVRLRTSIPTINFRKGFLYGLCLDWYSYDNGVINGGCWAITHSSDRTPEMDEHKSWTLTYSFFHSRLTSYPHKFSYFHNMNIFHRLNISQIILKINIVLFFLDLDHHACIGISVSCACSYFYRHRAKLELLRRIILLFYIIDDHWLRWFYPRRQYWPTFKTSV